MIILKNISVVGDALIYMYTLVFHNEKKFLQRIICLAILLIVNLISDKTLVFKTSSCTRNLCTQEYDICKLTSSYI